MSPKRSPGRPRLHPEGRVRKLSISISPTLHEALRADAAELGVSLSHVCEQAIIAGRLIALLAQRPNLIGITRQETPL